MRVVGEKTGLLVVTFVRRVQQSRKMVNAANKKWEAAGQMLYHHDKIWTTRALD